MEGRSLAVKSFEDLRSWQAARELVRKVYRLTEKPAFRKDRGLCDQIQRAAVSTMSNIAEGFDRGGNAEFLQFLSIAKGSAAEVLSQLYVSLDMGYISKGEFEETSSEARALGNMIGRLMGYLKQSPRRGQKFDVKPPKGIREELDLILAEIEKNPHP
ncbi:MAG: four helix bundle protein [Nitrospinota bacterium]